MPIPHKRVIASLTAASMVAAGLLAASCGGGGGGGGSTKALAGLSPAAFKRAAAATAGANSFVISSEGVEVTYVAPDRSMQIEHGEAESSTGVGSSGPHSSTITKIFIGNRAYERQETGGRADPFTVSDRCPGSGTFADVLLAVLRQISSTTGGRGQAAGEFVYDVSVKQRGLPMRVIGNATVASGYIRTLTLAAGPGPVRSATFSSINHAPPIVAPASADPISVTCGTS